VRKYSLLAVIILFCFFGCATTEDLEGVRGGMKYLNDKIDATGENVRLLREENARAKKDEEVLSAVRARQAEIGADISELRESVQKLRGEFEVFRKDFDAAQLKSNHRDEEINVIKRRLDTVPPDADYVGKEKESPETGEKLPKRTPKGTSKGKADKEGAYAAAYEEFKAGRYEKARTAFQDFLKQYPETEYSDNAQFWIGECYYFEKNYEKAVLEYDKVAKKYPDGDKAPVALLKQGLSFLNLGDKTSARIILQKVIKEYPNTNQARIAKAKLKEI
jgi:tol-pal system protein YbgF